MRVEGIYLLHRYIYDRNLCPIRNIVTRITSFLKIDYDHLIMTSYIWLLWALITAVKHIVIKKQHKVSFTEKWIFMFGSYKINHWYRSIFSKATKATLSNTDRSLFSKLQDNKVTTSFLSEAWAVLGPPDQFVFKACLRFSYNSVQLFGDERMSNKLTVIRSSKQLDLIILVIHKNSHCSMV